MRHFTLDFINPRASSRDCCAVGYARVDLQVLRCAHKYVKMWLHFFTDSATNFTQKTNQNMTGMLANNMRLSKSFVLRQLFEIPFQIHVDLKGNFRSFRYV